MSRQVNTNSKPRWKPSSSHEAKRLATSADYSISTCGPSLPRTRGMLTPRQVFTTPQSTSTLTDSAISTSKASNDGDGEEEGRVPSASRIILEKNKIRSMMERHILCPLCKSSVTVSFPTVCIASACRIECNNKMCSYVDIERPSGADVPLPEGSGSPLIERNTDYAINIQFVLGFMTSGDGGKEAERILGLLGLPNYTTMEKRSFTTIEEITSGPIQELGQEVLFENLSRAVEVHYGGRQHNGVSLFELWKDQIKPNNKDNEILPRHLYPKLTTASDMAWQKRSSGNKCDSNSGHAALVDADTRLVIAYIVKTKLCSICIAHARKKNNPEPVREHKCNINHVGSAGSMEPKAILEMVVDMYDNRYAFAEYVITDDDSSIKAKLKWNNDNWMLNNNTTDTPKVLTSGGNEVVRPNRGELPRHIPEPKMLADPNHRKKTLKGVLYKHLKVRKDLRHGLTRCDVIRVTTNFCYMVRSLKQYTTDDEIVTAGKAVVEHHFDNHEYCGAFCKRKPLNTEQRQQQQKLYRDKTKHANLYAYLTETMARFITLDALKEVQHGSDTLLNESLNNTIAWLAPKNKTYSSTQSLLNRVSIAVCISTLGTRVYFDRLFEKLGIVSTRDMQYYLDKQQKTRLYRIDMYKKASSKLQRNKKFHEALKKHTEEAKKLDGFYQPGVGMDGGYAAADTTATTQPKKRSNGPVICPICGGKGHKTMKSKHCTGPPDGGNATSNTTTEVSLAELQARIDGDEQELLDQLPLDVRDDKFFHTLDAADAEEDESIYFDCDEEDELELGIL